MTLSFLSKQKYATSQPGAVTGIAYGNPITKGLTGLINAGPGLKGDLLSGQQAWGFTLQNMVAAGGIGIGQTTPGTSGVWWDRASNGQPTSGPDVFRFTSPVFSLVAVFTPLGFSSSDFIFGSSSGSDGWLISGRFSDGTLQAVVNDGSLRILQSTSGKTILNTLNVVVVTCDGTTMTLYNNGVSLGTVAVGGTPLSYGGNFNQIELGGAVTPFGNIGAPAVYYYGGIWNRNLNTSEINSLAANPWQVFKQKSVSFFPSGGGISLAWYKA